MERIDRGCGVYFAVRKLASKAAAVKKNVRYALPCGPTKEGVLPTCWKKIPNSRPPHWVPSFPLPFLPKPKGMLEKES